MPSEGGPTLLAEDTPVTRDDDGLERLLTVPNVLSVGRLALLAVFLYLLFGDGARVAAAVVLVIAGGTDFLDGFLARRLGQVTRLGKVLDPTADRIVLGCSVLAITVYGAVPPWLAAVVLAREVLVSVGAIWLAALGARRIDVLFVGKAGTFGLMGCFPLMLLADTKASWGSPLRDATWALVVLALALSFYAAASYVPLARRALAERAGASGVVAG